MREPLYNPIISRIEENKKKKNKRMKIVCYVSLCILFTSGVGFLIVWHYI